MQDEALQAYLDHIEQSLLDKDRPLRQSKEGDEARSLARARTLTVLWRLDGSRKGSLLQFLYDSHLIRKDRAVIDLGGTYLASAHLWASTLPDVDLSRADLSRANLSRADLSRADLRGADVRYANLTEADLRGADLSEADLSGADLSYAILSNSNLTGALLDSAEGITNDGLVEQQPRSLTGATMPNGQKYEEWLKDKEARGEYGEERDPS